MFTYIYASDDDNEDGNGDDDNVSRVPLKNINAIISMMMINVFVAPLRALAFTFFFRLYLSTSQQIRTYTTGKMKDDGSGATKKCIKRENLLTRNESHD